MNTIQKCYDENCNSNNTTNAFEDFLLEKNDQIYFFAHQLLCSLASNKPISTENELSDIIEWDMSRIGNLVSHAMTILENDGISTCYPFYEAGPSEEDTKPCICGTDCARTDCVFSRKKLTDN